MARKKRKYTKRQKTGMPVNQYRELIYGEAGSPKTMTGTAMFQPAAGSMDRKALGEHVSKLISKDRNETHGDPHIQFACAQALKEVFDRFVEVTAQRSQLGKTEIESMEMILTKVSRLTCGSNLQDAWLDIAGYALIAAEKAEKPL